MLCVAVLWKAFIANECGQRQRARASTSCQSCHPSIVLPLLFVSELPWRVFRLSPLITLLGEGVAVSGCHWLSVTGLSVLFAFCFHVRGTARSTESFRTTNLNEPQRTFTEPQREVLNCDWFSLVFCTHH